MTLLIGNKLKTSPNYLKPKISKSGIVLIELIIVVFIIGIFSIFALPGFRKFSREINLERASRNLSQTIRFVHFHSVSEGIKYRMYFNLEKDIYWLEKASDANDEFEKLTTSLIRERKLSHDIEFWKINTPRNENILMGEGYLNFSPDGSSENCLIYLKNKNEKINTVVVKGPTGRVVIYDYEYKEE